ncbi:MAG: hypothetical protein ABSF57_02935 [Acidobacteriaceae bacterium]|jgi:hypothetical protein
MLKKIPAAMNIAVGVILVVSAIVFATYVDHRAADKYQRLCQEQVPKVSPGAGEQDAPSAKECDDPKDYMPWWSKLVAWPEGIGGWALIATGFVIAWQSWETRKAAEASAESARAALLSAHASVNAERAQLLFVTKKVKGDRHGKAIFEIWVKNFGKTPARLVGWRPQNEVFVPDTKNLPIPPVYDGLYAVEGYLIPQGEILVASYDPFQPGHMVQRITVSKTDNIGVHEVQAVVYGQVEYLDGITHDRQTSRYCFRFEREPFSNIGGSIEPCGPPEYNLCT